MAASGKSRQATPRQRRPEGELADIYAIYTSRLAGRDASHRLVRLFDPAESAGTATLTDHRPSLISRAKSHVGAIKWV